MKEVQSTLKILISLLILFFFSFCSEQKIKPNVDLTIEEENIPVQESWDSKIIFSENGIIKGILYTDHVQSFDKPKEKLLDGVKIEFFNHLGIKTSQLTSKEGKIDDLTQDMYAIDSVVAINDSANVMLESDELMWRKKDEKIVTDKFVRITSPEEIIEGYGLVSDKQLKNYVIRNVTYQTVTRKNND